MFNLLTMAIFPKPSLSSCIANWGTIAHELRERQRKRPLKHKIVVEILYGEYES